MSRSRQLLIAVISVLFLAAGTCGFEGDSCESMFDCADDLDCVDGVCTASSSSAGSVDNACETFNDTTSYFGDGQLDAYCIDAGYWQACGNTEYQNLDCSNLEGMIDCCWDGGGDCPYCPGA